MIKPHIFGVDFDGTVVLHEWPKVGADVPMAVGTMLEMVNVNKHQLVLNTMRSGKELDDAVAWFAAKQLPLFGVNVNPTQHTWTKSPKVYAHYYIDDAAIGVPLITGVHSRPYVDWSNKGIRELLYRLGLFECPYMR